MSMSSLLKSQTEEQLARVLTKRPTVSSLVSQGIMLDPRRKGMSVQLAQRQLMRQKERDRLSHFLTQRPTLDQLVRRSLMEDTMTWTRVAQQSGAIPLPRTCHTVNHFPHSAKLFLLYDACTLTLDTRLNACEQHCSRAIK